MLAFVLGGMGLLSMTLSTLPTLPITVVLLAIMLGLLGMGNGAVFQMVGVRLPTRVGAMTGLVGAAGGLGGFALPFAFGALKSSTGGFGTGFFLLGSLSLIGSFVALNRQRAWFRSPEMVTA